MSDKSLADYPLSELKIIYQTLQAQIALQPSLMDSELLEDLQRFLQKQAGTEGIDVSLHAQWATWLNESPDVKGVNT